MPAPSHFDPPVVVARFPTYAVLCWEPPRAATNKTFAEHMSWDYRVEYSCACRTRHQPYAMSTASTYALLATPHSGETYYVRLVARATFAGAMAGLVSAKTSFVAESAMTMPWSAGAPSPCIFDGLYVCAADAWDTAAVSAAMCESRRVPTHEHGCKLETECCTYSLETDMEFRLYKAAYDEAVAPADKRTVFYLAATGRRTRAGQRLHHKDVERLLLRDDAALVLCGVGDGGRVAVKAAHAILSSLLTSNPRLSHSVFCITYGTPRGFLKDGSQLLVHTLPRSYQFLHVTQLPVVDGTAALTANVAVSSRCTKGDSVFTPLRLTGYAEGFYSNTLLGVQCSLACLNSGNGARSDLREATAQLHFHAAHPALPPTAGEESEVFDVVTQLRRLAQAFFPSTSRWLAPAITSLRCRTAGPLLYTAVEGRNLQFCPRLTILPPPHAAAFPRVTSCEPHRLACVSSLLPWIEACATKRDGTVAAPDLQVCVLVQTSFGTCAAFASEAVELPGDFMELFRWCGVPVPPPWAVATPSALLECALQTQPLYALSQSAARPAAVDGAAVNAVAEALSAIASAAEAAVTEKMRAGAAGGSATGSVFGFVSDVAARFSSAVGNASTEGVPKLSVPMREAAFLKNALREWTASTATGIDVWRLRSASWKQRIEHAFPSLGDTQYRETVIRMLRLFDRHAVDTSADAVPLPWLEARLYTHVRLCVSLRPASTDTDMSDLLCVSMTLGDFYAAIANVFDAAADGLSATVATPASLPHVSEAMLLWCLCHCFELRRELSCTFFCCVVGCAGCGGSTLVNALTTLLQSADAPRCSPSRLRRRLPTCRVAASRLSALFLAMQSGVRLSVFLAGEVADLVRPQYAAMSMHIQESLAYPHQRWLRVITKADEHLRRTHVSGEAPIEPPAAEAVLEEAMRDVLGSSATEEKRLMISLAPSPSRIAHVFQWSQEQANDFASELRAASHRTLLKCLTSSLDQGDAVTLQ